MTTIMCGFLRPAMMGSQSLPARLVRSSRVPFLGVRSVVAQSNAANSQQSHQVPVQQQARQQAAPQQQRQQQAQHAQRAQRQPQQVGARLQRQSAPFIALSPLADFGSVAPGFGRVGGFLRSIEDEMDSMMQALSAGNDDMAAAPTSDLRQDIAVPLQVDIREIDKEIVIKADTPGMTGADVKVTFEPESRVLNISGERASEHTDKDESSGYTRIERRFGAFQRRFKLPPNADAASITAKVVNGELEIRVAKTEANGNHQEIPVS
jgi:HSP20 family molecular chaperone IbpA